MQGSEPIREWHVAWDLVWVVVRMRLWGVVPSEHDVMNVRERVMGEGGPLMVLNK